ncbi:hypothetical protein MLD38_003577 [Melastoma candidum]|uniref:Uncharacterized protein n=1 Tax=Melastoma candidum TaxID=119954 RepID=A0ACB9S6W6_9MYRT|nr:hypothetical protein MLD38_003577 [Melastoma candidum]
MAPTTLTSNSFLLIHPTLCHARSPRLVVSAKKSPPQSEDSPPSPGGFPQFKFDFGKLPDVKSMVPVVSQPSVGMSFRRKDPRTVFVAGATGQAGIRIAQRLLREGFSVRAGVPELGAAQELARLAAAYKIISNDESRRLNAVESTFQDVESIAKAIGNSSKVVVTIGPAELGPSAEVTPSNALLVVQAAKLAGVSHIVVVYDRNPSVGSSTYNVLDGISTFFSNLFSRTQAMSLPEFIQGLVEADVSYTLIKASLTDDYAPESSYNVVVSAEGSGGSGPGDYKVAKSRIASLVAGVFSNTAVAENKVVEVSVDPSAPLKPTDELFSAIPEDGRRKEYAELLAKAKAEEALLAAEKDQEAADAVKKLEEEAAEQNMKTANLTEQAKENVEAARISVEGIFDKAKGIGAGFSLEKLNFNFSNGASEPEEKPKVQIATIRGRAKAQSLPAKKAVVKKPSPPPRKPVKEKVEEKKEVRKVFGGLFQQETVYIDDD